MESVSNVTKGVIKRLVLKASLPFPGISVGSLSSFIYSEVRYILVTVLEELCLKADKLSEMRKAQTISRQDVHGAIESIYYLRNMTLPDGYKKVKTCPDVSRKKFGIQDNKEIKRRRIEESHKMFNCFIIPKSVFRKMCDELISSRKSVNAVLLLQEVVEKYIVKVLNITQQITIDGKRKTLYPRTLYLAVSMIKNNSHDTIVMTHQEKFDRYIRRQLLDFHSNFRISKDALYQTNTILNLIANKLTQESIKISRQDKKSTISQVHLETVVNMVLPGELSKYAIEHIRKVIENSKVNGVPKMNNQIRGLGFPPSRTGKFLHDQKGRVSGSSKIAFAAILDYICAEIIELSSDVSYEEGKETVTLRHLLIGISKDENLKQLVEHEIGYSLPFAGDYIY